MISNIVPLIVIFVNVLLCLVILPIVIFNYVRFNFKTFISFIGGAILYFVCNKILGYYFIASISKMAPDLPIWSNKILNFIFLALVIAVFSEVMRLMVLFLFRSNKTNKSTLVWNTMLGLGEGWFAAVLGWGVYMYYLAMKLYAGENVYSFEFSYSSITFTMLERVIEIIFFIGMTYFVQSIVNKKKILSGLAIAVVIHCLMTVVYDMMMYIFCFPRIVVDILYCMLACYIFVFGYKQLRSVNNE